VDRLPHPRARARVSPALPRARARARARAAAGMRRPWGVQRATVTAAHLWRRARAAMNKLHCSAPKDSEALEREAQPGGSSRVLLRFVGEFVHENHNAQLMLAEARQRIHQV
jgi:hypothetical protein